MNAVPLKVLLVEDSAAILDRVQELLSEDPLIETAGAVTTEQAAIEAVRMQSPDAIVLDLFLAKGSGFGVLSSLNGMKPRPYVVVMTTHAAAQIRRQALELGADIFLDKTRDIMQLPEILSAYREQRRN